MDVNCFDRLTDAQRVCLRLVFQHKSSKEIARELKISKDTVDQRLDRARKLLGVATRIEAAQALAHFEQEYHRVVYDAPAVAGDDLPAAARALIEEGVESNRRTYHAVHEERAEYHPASPQKWGMGLPLRARGEEPDDLSLSQRLLWIAVIAVGVPLLLGSLISGLLALGEIAHALTNHFR